MAARVISCHLGSVSAGALQVSPIARVASWNACEHEPGRPVEPKTAAVRLSYCGLALHRRAFRVRLRGDSSCLAYYMTPSRFVKRILAGGGTEGRSPGRFLKRRLAPEPSGPAEARRSRIGYAGFLKAPRRGTSRCGSSEEFAGEGISPLQMTRPNL